MRIRGWGANSLTNQIGLGSTGRIVADQGATLNAQLQNVPPYAALKKVVLRGAAITDAQAQ